MKVRLPSLEALNNNPNIKAYKVFEHIYIEKNNRVYNFIKIDTLGLVVDCIEETCFTHNDTIRVNHAVCLFKELVEVLEE